MDIILTIPVYNEEKILKKSITKLYNYLSKNIDKKWQIIIVNNASTDKTKQISNNLANKYQEIETVHLSFKGRGNALKYIWTKYESKIHAYCDVDLATDINHLKELFDSVSNGYDIAIGSRYSKKSKSKRNVFRNITGLGYIFLVKLFFRTKLHDFQCGFKAVNNKIAKNLISKLTDKEWFFDTEMLITAEKQGFKIKEIPVIWNEMGDSKVKILKTAFNYIKNLMKLKKK